MFEGARVINEEFSGMGSKQTTGHVYHFWYMLEFGGGEMNKIRRYRSGFTARKQAGRGCLIGCAVSTRTTGALWGSTSCDAVRLADREATGQKPQGWSLGSALYVT